MIIFWELLLWYQNVCITHLTHLIVKKKKKNNNNTFLFGHIQMYTQISPGKMPLFEKWNILKNYKQFVIHNNKQCEWPNIASTSISL